jgi:hypothetical protein
MNNTNEMFNDLCLPIPSLVYTFTHEKQLEIYNYLAQLDVQQKKAYIIAYNHLGTSFNISKSNGYKEWKKQL